MKYDQAKIDEIRASHERRMDALRAAQLGAPDRLLPVISRRVHRLLAEDAFLISVAILIRDGGQA